MNIKELALKTKRKAIEHSPEILVGVGIAGMVTSTVLAVKATPKALQLIEDAKVEKQDELTRIEVVKATWKCYIPATVTGVVAAGCLISGNKVSLRRNAALATACKLSEAAFTEYREKVVETIGEKKEKAVQDKIVEDRLEKNPVTEAHVYPLDTRDHFLCMDYVSNEYFYANKNRIDAGVNAINRAINTDPFNTTSIETFYDAIGINPKEDYSTKGWNIDMGEIKLDEDYKAASDGRPCMIVKFNPPPVLGYADRKR